MRKLYAPIYINKEQRKSIYNISMSNIQKILVVRFRQMGDAILATALLNTLRQSFPQAEIHFVLNDNIAPLFEGHPSIDRIITFSEEERHHTLTYLRKVWRTVHSEHYDVIIDMRSTFNTMLFAIFSPATKYRIGLKKGYTGIAFNCRMQGKAGQSMVEHNSSLASFLKTEGDIRYTKDFTLAIADAEKQEYGEYLKSQGIDLGKPVMLANVTAKLANKVWDEEKMTGVLRTFMEAHPDVQVIFNYAPGKEEENARRIYEKLGQPSQVFIDVKARSSRQLVALSGYITIFFGNEGGARHIAQAAGAPSLVICAPENKKSTWIPQNSVPAEGISPSDFLTEEQLAAMSREQQYDVIDQETVSRKLEEFYSKTAK